MRRLFVPRVALAAAVACLNACGDAAPPTEATAVSLTLTRDSAAQFQTDSLAYNLRAGSIGYEASLVVLYTNQTTKSASFANCAGATMFTFEKLVGSEWRIAWSPIVALCLSPPIVVPPGGTHAFEIYVFGGYPGCNCAPRFFSEDVAGVYRAVWRDGFNADPGAGETLSLERRVSNRFALTVPSR